MKDDSIGVARASSAKYLIQCSAYKVQCLVFSMQLHRSDSH
jgi:hypothetical protein